MTAPKRGGEPRPRAGALPHPRSSRDADLVTFRELLRVSHDASGVERSNDEQHGDHVGAVESEPRWSLSDLPPYRDVGSASEFASRRRAGFDALLSDLARGEFGADVLLMWESSRGSRRTGEWVTLIELCGEAGVLLCVYSHGMRFYDPNEPRDRRSLLEDAIDAEYETAKTSMRVRRAMAKNAAAGKPNGGRRAYGYTPDGLHTVPEEVEHIRDAAARVLRGESPRSIAKSWNEQGIKSATGGEWHPGPLAAMLRGNRIVGIRTHHGKVVAHGGWPAIITDAEHRRIVATLASRSRVGERGRHSWELTGLLRCGLCGAALVGNTDAGSRGSAGRRRYVCRKAPGYHGCGRLSIKAEPVEELLGRIVVAALGDFQARRAAVPAEDDAAERRELEALAAARVEVADQYAIDRDAGAKNEAMAALRRREEVVERALAAKVRQASPLAFVLSDGLQGRTWEDTPIEARRVVLQALIEHVAVGPATVRGSTRFESARITDGITWRA